MFLGKRRAFCNLLDEFFFRQHRFFPLFYFLVIDSIRIIVPDVYIVIDEIFNVGLPREKPVQFMKNTVPIHFLGREEWKSLRQIKTNLTTEYAVGFYTRPSIGLFLAIFECVAHEVEILVFGMPWFHSSKIIYSFSLSHASFLYQRALRQNGLNSLHYIVPFLYRYDPLDS